MSKVYENDEIREGTTEETRTVKTNLGGVEPLEKAKQSDSVNSNTTTKNLRVSANAKEQVTALLYEDDFEVANNQLEVFANIKPQVKPEVFTYCGLQLSFYRGNSYIDKTVVQNFPSTITVPNNVNKIKVYLAFGHGALDSGYNETFDCDVELYQNTKNIVLEER